MTWTTGPALPTDFLAQHDWLADVFDLRFDATRPSRADAYGTRSSTHTERGRQAIESVGVDGAHVAVHFDVDAVDSPDLALANFLRVCGWAPERAGSIERHSAAPVSSDGWCARSPRR